MGFPLRFRLHHVIFAVVAALLSVALAPSAAAQSRADVMIELDHFGVGNVYRQGEITGIRVRLTANPASNLGEATMVWVQWEVPDGNGDIAEYGRMVTLTRGRPTPVWLYAPLPPSFTPDDVCTIRVFEFSDGRRRMELGGRRLRPGDAAARPDMVYLNTAMIGIVGQRHMGLRAYADVYDQLERPFASHERTRLAIGMRPTELPDRRDGLHGFEAIAWADVPPQELSSDAATALREYVRAGGHLIIVLPQDINPWQFGSRGQTLLEDLLPQREPRRDDGVQVRDLLPVLSKARDTNAQFNMSIRVFRDLRGTFNAIDNYYEPLIALPDGRVVVIQRQFGHGRITVSGIDVSSGQLGSMPLSVGSPGLPHADVFWNRILGRRADTPSTADLEQIREADLLLRSTAANQNFGSGGLISQQIAMSTQAGLGLMLALMLFGGYWLLAGPGGYALLKSYKQVRHAWVAFALVAGAFTAVAWGAVGLLREKEPQIRHLTILDHVARPLDQSRPGDPQLQRAVSWFELYVPGYTRPRVTLESNSGYRNLLLPWTSPGDTIQRFPNIDRYTVDVGSQPNSYTIPARSTSTQMFAHWMGGVAPEWGGLIRSHPDDPIRVITDASGNELSLTGAIVHDLPGALRGVTIIWNRGNRLSQKRFATSDNQELPWVPRLMSGQMLNAGAFFALSGPLERGAVLDLRGLVADGSTILSRGIEQRYVSQHRSSIGQLPRAITTDTRREFLEMLSMFHQLTPPEYLRERPGAQDQLNRVVFNRHVGRELDLSEWFSHPCIIVIGYLENSELPMPLRLNDSERTVTSSGTTMIRWIYPLPVNEQLAFPERLTEED